MTNEKIIINGIDVTECLYRKQNPHNFCMCSSVTNGSDIIVQCEYNPNCYFKQLKRKEQEYKELNSDNCYFVNKIISLELLLDEYEQALNEIEKIIEDTADTQTNNAKWLHQYYLARFWEIGNIIDEAKEK
nr:MAG TPA: hypothetical protein [Herelleviridae sp.]